MQYRTVIARKEEPTVEQMNREVAEWLGIKWDNRQFGCGGRHRHSYSHDDGTPGNWLHHHHDDRCINPNPDFSQGAGIIRLLKEMMKREDFRGTNSYNGFSAKIGRWYYNGGELMFNINSDYIATPGKLLQAVWPWSKEHPG
jgi:hypothetical protein